MKISPKSHDHQEHSQAQISLWKDIFLQKKIPDPSLFYQGEGRSLYDKICSSQAYRANKVEMEILSKHADSISPYLGTHITDIGCGNGEKASCLLKAAQDGISRTYIASDASARMIELAEQHIQKEVPDIHIGNHQIMRPGNSLFTNTLKDNTYLCLGFLLGDFDRPGMTQQLKDMNNKGIITGNNILLSYFEAPKTTQERQRTLDLYQNDEGKAFILNGIQNMGLDPRYFDHKVAYDEQDRCVYISVELNQDYEIHMPKPHMLRKGESYRVYQSRRFSYEEIQSVFKKIACKELKHFSQDGVSVVLLRQNPAYAKKTLKIVAVTVGMLLGALGIQQGVSAYQRTIEKRNIELAIEKKANEMSVFTVFEGKGSKIDSLSMQKYIKETAVTFSNIFAHAFGKGSLSSLDVQYLIIDAIDQEQMEKIFDYDKPLPASCQFFLETFLPRNELLCIKKGISTIPYKDFIVYEETMKASLLYQGDQTVPQNVSSSGLISPFAATYYKELPDYVSSSGVAYKVGIAQGSLPYMVAKWSDEVSKGYEDPYSFARGREVALDYFLWKHYTMIQQRYAIIQEAFQFGKGMYDLQERWEMRCLITQYTAFHPQAQSPHEYIQSFLQAYPQELSALGLTTPYKEVFAHQDALHNSIAYFEDRKDPYDIFISTFKDLAKYDVQFLGAYMTAQGEEYILACITVKGKRYMVARERYDMADEYSIYDARNVAEDFFAHWVGSGQ